MMSRQVAVSALLSVSQQVVNACRHIEHRLSWETMGGQSWLQSILDTIMAIMIIIAMLNAKLC